MTTLRTLAMSLALSTALAVLADDGGGRFVETPLPGTAGRDAPTARPSSTGDEQRRGVKRNERDITAHS